jgi:hypothetical protein
MQIPENCCSGALLPHNSSTDWTRVFFLKPLKDTVLTENMSAGKSHGLNVMIETDRTELRVHALDLLRGGVASVFLSKIREGVKGVGGYTVRPAREFRITSTMARMREERLITLTQR